MNETTPQVFSSEDDAMNDAANSSEQLSRELRGLTTIVLVVSALIFIILLFIVYILIVKGVA